METKIIKLKNILKENNFPKFLGEYINSIIPSKLYLDAKDYQISINEYISRLEDDQSQHTVVISTQISYSGVKNFLAFHFNKKFSPIVDNRLKVLTKDEYKKHKDFQKYENLAFDVVFELDGDLIPLEIKVTQGKDCFSGATHSTSKVNDYLLISLEIDRDITVNDGVEFIKSMFIAITSIDSVSWKGEASSNSSWTSFKFSIYDNNQDVIDYTDDIIIGNLVKKRSNSTNYAIITESFK